MSRRYIIYEECMVMVKIGASTPVELGLTSEPIHIAERLYHHDINIDDFGPNIPAAVLTMGGDVTIRMTLVHYDPDVMDDCIAQAKGRSDGFPGVLGAVGTPIFSRPRGLGIRLNLIPLKEKPWRFFSAHLDGNPLEIPIGTERTLLAANWRALPNKSADFIEYRGNVGEIRSAEAIIWDNGIDE